MVSKITIFEGHFDGAQFGPASIGAEDEADKASDTEAIEERSPRRPGGRRMLGIGIVSTTLLAVIVVLRRFRNKSRGDDQLSVEIEEAAEQKAPAE